MNKSYIKFFFLNVASSSLREIVLCNFVCSRCARCTSDILCTCSSSSYWFFILSSQMVNRTTSHICDKLSLPMFLLRVELFTHINNHHKFTLRCISQDIIPVHIKPKTPINTNNIRQIIHKTARKLFLECIRTISNTLKLCVLNRDR